MSTLTNPKERRSSHTGLIIYRIVAYTVLILLSLLCLFFFYVRCSFPSVLPAFSCATTSP